MFDVDINLWAVLVAGAAGWIVGSVWYGVFAKPWMALAYPGKKREDLRGSNIGYGAALLAYLVAAYVLALFAGYYEVASVTEGIMIGLLAWIGFVATTFGMNYWFGGRPAKLYLIDVGNYLVSFLVIGAIIGAWQ